MERSRTQSTLVDGYVRDLGDPMIEGEPHEVFADIAYIGKSHQARLEAKDIFCVIIERSVRDQPVLPVVQKAHNRLCTSFRAIVEYLFTRFIRISADSYAPATGGLRHNALDFG